jgi:hypothetical protein
MSDFLDEINFPTRRQIVASLASADYPELEEILEERPPLEASIPTNRSSMAKVAMVVDGVELPDPQCTAYELGLHDSSTGAHPRAIDIINTIWPGDYDDYKAGYNEVYQKDGSFHKASWQEVQDKAHDIYTIGGVRIIAELPNSVVAHVLGDHGTYLSQLDIEKGTKNVAQWQCFLPDAPVMMEGGTEKAISEVVVGDRIITHTGEIHEVVRVESKPSAKSLATVSFRGDPRPFVATEDHQVWALRDGVPKWIFAGDLTPEDFVGFSIPQETNPLVVAVDRPTRRPVRSASGIRGVYPYRRMKPDGSSYDKWVFRTKEGGRRGISHCRYFNTVEEAASYSEEYYSKLETEEIEITPDLAYLIGWYVAEGLLEYDSLYISVKNGCAMNWIRSVNGILELQVPEEFLATK